MILIIDDDSAVRSSLNLLLKQSGFESRLAEDPEEALGLCKEETFDLFILDMNFSVNTTGEEGLAFLRKLKLLYPGIPVILITAWGSIDLAVEGMKLGASDFICKPWNNELLVSAVRTALNLASPESAERMSLSRKKLNDLYHFDNIVGNDRALLSILNLAGRVAQTDAPVLILGESGTGKELIAEAIHNNSKRADGPFIKVNLGGIPGSLFESEMFGHKKGAFTDAISDREGRFELADGGTIFLDEIGDLDVSGQVKLLRVLQDRTFERLGESRTIRSDFRVISATNKDLGKMVAERKFREDLYYRINLVSLTLPPLRNRAEDVPELVAYFVDNLKAIYNRPELKVNISAVNWLAEQPWPGNIRELKNLVERTVLSSGENSLESDHFSLLQNPSPAKVNKDQLPAVGAFTIEEIEESMIKKALEHHDGNISRTARALGLSRTALYRRLDKYGISI